jgi:hypothetical protein
MLPIGALFALSYVLLFADNPSLISAVIGLLSSGASLVLLVSIAYRRAALTTWDVDIARNPGLRATTFLWDESRNKYLGEEDATEDGTAGDDPREVLRSYDSGRNLRNISYVAAVATAFVVPCALAATNRTFGFFTDGIDKHFGSWMHFALSLPGFLTNLIESFMGSSPIARGDSYLERGIASFAALILDLLVVQVVLNIVFPGTDARQEEATQLAKGTWKNLSNTAATELARRGEEGARAFLDFSADQNKTVQDWFEEKMKGRSWSGLDLTAPLQALAMQNPEHEPCTIKTLMLVNCRIRGDALVRALKGITALEDLNLKSSSFGSDVLNGCPQLPSLRRLKLNYTGIGDAALRQLGGTGSSTCAPCLQILYLGQAQLSKEGLWPIANFRDLEELDLQRIKAVDDEVVAHLCKGLRQLRTIYLWGTELTEAGVEHIAQLSTLENLNLGGNERIGDRALELLGRSPCDLKVLWLQDTRVSNEAIARLREARPKLTIYP